MIYFYNINRDIFIINTTFRRCVTYSYVNIFNLNSELLYVAESYNDASFFLGMKEQGNRIKYYIDNTRSYFSPKLNQEVFIRSIVNENSDIDSLINTRPLYVMTFKEAVPLTLINKNLNELSPLFIYLFTHDKSSFLTFFTAQYYFFFIS